MANVPNVADVTAKGFITKADRKESLVEKLKKLVDVLTRFSSAEELPSLQYVVRALVAPQVLRSALPRVRMLGAVCLADLLRLTAPDPPYDKDIMQEVFKLIIRQLAPPDGDPRSLSLHFGLLESLSVADTCLILVEDVGEDGGEAMLISLFEALFNLAPLNDPKKKYEPHAMGILKNCVSELEVVTPALLDVFLMRLLATDPSSRWAASLMARCSDQLEAPVIEFVTRVIIQRQKPHASSRLVERRQHMDLVYELITQCSSVFLSLVPQLQDALQDGEYQVRADYIDVFGRVFCLPQVAQQYKQLLLSFLGRFNDVEASIRAMLADFSKDFLLKLPTFRQHISGYLISRCRDKEESVRGAVVRAACEAAMKDPQCVSTQLLSAVGGRTLDKKQAIRLESCEQLARLFQRHVGPYWRKQKALPENSRKFTWIPKTLLKCSFIDTDLTERIENLFDDHIFDSSRSMQERSHLILGVYTSLEGDEETTKKFKRMFLSDKKSAQELITNLLLTRELMKERGMSDHRRHRIARKREALARMLAQKLPAKGGKGEQAAVDIILQKFVASKDNKLAKWLQDMATPTTEFSVLRSSKDALAKALTSRSSASEYAKRLSTRCSLTSMSPEIVELMIDAVANTNIDAIRASAISLLRLASTLYPAMFRTDSALETLGGMVEGSAGDEDEDEEEDEVDQQTKEFALEVLARVVTSKDSAPALKDVIPALKHLALNGSHLEAAPAISILLKMQSADDKKMSDDDEDEDGDEHEDAVNMEEILKTSLASLDVKDPAFCAKLTVAREIARHAPTLFDADAQRVVDFVAKELLLSDLATSESIAAAAANAASNGGDADADVSDADSGSDADAAQRKRKSKKSKKKTKKARDELSQQLAMENEQLLNAKVIGIEILVVYLASLAKRIDVDPLSCREATDAADLSRLTKERQRRYKHYFSLIGSLLFNVLHTDGAITQARLERRVVEDKEARVVVIAAAQGLLNLCRVRTFEEHLQPDHFQCLAMVAHNDQKEVRNAFLMHLWEGLKASKLPEHYGIILSLAASCREDAMRNHMRQALAILITRRRRQNELRAQVSNGEPLELSSYPEYDLVYLVYVLAHHPDFEDDSRANFAYILKFLDAYFDALLQGQRKNNFTLILQVLNHVKSSCDVHRDPEYQSAKRVQRCAELAQRLLKRRYEGKAWSNADATARLDIELPKDRYAPTHSASASSLSHLSQQSTEEAKAFDPMLDAMRPFSDDEDEDESDAETAATSSSKKRGGGKSSSSSSSKSHRKENSSGSSKERTKKRAKKERRKSKKRAEDGIFLGKKFSLPSDQEIRGFHHLAHGSPRPTLSQRSVRSQLSHKSATRTRDGVAVSSQQSSSAAQTHERSSTGVKRKKPSAKPSKMQSKKQKTKKQKKWSALTPAASSSAVSASSDGDGEDEDDNSEDVPKAKSMPRKRSRQATITEEEDKGEDEDGEDADDESEESAYNEDRKAKSQHRGRKRKVDSVAGRAKKSRKHAATLSSPTPSSPSLSMASPPRSPVFVSPSRKTSRKRTKSPKKPSTKEKENMTPPPPSNSKSKRAKSNKSTRHAVAPPSPPPSPSLARTSDADTQDSDGEDVPSSQVSESFSLKSHSRATSPSKVRTSPRLRRTRSRPAGSGRAPQPSKSTKASRSSQASSLFSSQQSEQSSVAISDFESTQESVATDAPPNSRRGGSRNAKGRRGRPNSVAAGSKPTRRGRRRR